MYAYLMVHLPLGNGTGGPDLLVYPQYQYYGMCMESDCSYGLGIMVSMETHPLWKVKMHE